MREVFRYVGAITILFLASITGTNMLLRPSGAPIAGAPDLTSFGAVVFMSIAVVFAELEHAHTVVDILLNKFNVKTKGLILKISAVISAIIAAFLGFESFIWFIQVYRRAECSETLRVPLAPFVLCITGCFVLLCFCLVAKTLAKEKLKT